jgi:hypothetical protein
MRRSYPFGEHENRPEKIDDHAGPDERSPNLSRRGSAISWLNTRWGRMKACQ